jgi:NADH-quinone oxidoreductase subunit J
MIFSLEQLFFAFFAAILLISALTVIVARNTVRCALALALAFIASSGLWMLLHAEFLALILALVYVGAVMTLFLFVVMTLNLDTEPRQEGFVHYLPYGIVILALMAALIIYALKHSSFAAMTAPQLLNQDVNASNIKAIGDILYTVYAYPFELAGVLLLIAIVAAISLDLRMRRGKKQQASEQIAVKRENRIQLIK